MALWWRYDEAMGKKRALAVWETNDEADRPKARRSVAQPRTPKVEVDSDDDPYSSYDKRKGRSRGSSKADTDAALREEVERWITALIVLVLILVSLAGVSKEWFPS